MQGARVIASFKTTANAPPEAVIALHPLFVLATKQPSVVAIGTYTYLLLTINGPTKPIRINSYMYIFKYLFGKQQQQQLHFFFLNIKLDT